MKLIQSVKGKIMKNGLPEGYTRLEYLQSTGVQWIDTGIYPTQLTEVEYRCAVTGSVSNVDSHLFGSRLSASSEAFDIAYMNTQPNGIEKFRFIHGTTTTQETTTSITASQLASPHTYYMSGTLFKVDGSEKMSFTTISFTGTYSLWLFGVNSAGSLHNQVRAQRVYKCKIWDNGTLVRDFIPALDPSNKPCMYDLISKQPFYNLGTGADFSIGKKLTPVKYLESTGTQYIDTGVLPVNDMEFECKFTFTSLVSTNLTIVGSRDGEKRCQPIGVYNNKWSASIGGSYDANGTAVSANTPYIIKSTITNGQTITTNVNGSQVSTCTSTTGLPSQELYVFARNFYGNTDPADSKVNGRLYFLKIKANGVLVRDFIPVRDENNVGYMLDLLTNTLYTNAGTGAFTIGEDDLFVRNIGKTKFFKQTTRKVPKGFQEVEYLASDGNQWIDTGYTMTAGKSSAFEGTMMWTASQGNANFFYGYRSVNSAEYRGDMRAFFIYGASPAGRVAIRYGVNTDNSTQVAMSLNTNYKISFDGSNLKVNDTTYATLSEAYTPANYRSMWLFNCNTTGYYSADVNHFIGRIYRWKIFEDGIIVRDFIPYLDNNGRPCMWDMVEGKPYYNQGTSEFTYGRKIIPVEYLESTGEQYIDIGIKGKNNIDFDYKVNFTNVTTSSGFGIGGEWESGKSLYLGLIRSNGNFAYHYASTNAPVVVLNSVSANTDYSIQGHMWSGEQYMVINSTKSAVGTVTGTFESTQNITLFRVTSTSPIYCYAKIYYCKVWDNNILVRNFIPCIDENNTPYMFDKVTHSAFLNQGTGQFSYGDVIKERTEILRVLPIIRHLPLSYLESNGTQYIDTGLLSTADSKVDSTFSFTTMESGAANNVGVFGGRNNTTTNTFTFFKIASQTPQYFRFDFHSQPYVATANQMTWNTTSKYRFEYDGTKYTTTNTTTSQSVTGNLSPASSFTTSSICLFAVNTNGTIGQYLSGRIYHYWYTDGTNTIDLYPVLKLPERVPCMYDRISKTYFYNEGTGDFLYGFN